MLFKESNQPLNVSVHSLSMNSLQNVTWTSQSLHMQPQKHIGAIYKTIRDLPMLRALRRLIHMPFSHSFPETEIHRTYIGPAKPKINV